MTRIRLGEVEMLGRQRWGSVGVAAATLMLSGPAAAQEVSPAPTAEAVSEAAPVAVDIQAFADMSLDELLNVKITTATKTERTLEQSPSIVTVFSRADIERLGVRSLADLLQFVPGFYEVANGLQRNFAVRGIHAESPQHFVVLVDGLSSGDLLTSSSVLESLALEYVERVEIIRGPGSAIYGASALMGVVNLITRDGKKDAGFREELQVGTSQHLRDTVSWGADLGEQRSFYVSATVWGDGGTRAELGGDEDVLVPRKAMNISDGIQNGENLTLPQAETPVRVGRMGPSIDLFAKYQQGNTFALRLGFSRADSYLQRGLRQALVNRAKELQAPRYTTHRLVLDLERHVGDKSELGELTVRPAVTVFMHDMRSPLIPRRSYGQPDLQRNPNLDSNATIYGWAGTDVQFVNSLEYSLVPPNIAFVKDATLVAGLNATYGVAMNYRQGRCFLDPTGEVSNPSIYGAEDDLTCRNELFLNEGVAVDDFGNATPRDSDHNGDGDQWQLGAFAQYTAFLPFDIGLVVGGRVDRLSGFDLQWSPRVAMVAPLAGGFYAKAQYSRAFVYPAFLYRMGNLLAYYSGDPDVESESVDSAEMLLGFRHELLRAEVNGYYNSIHGFITYDPRRNAQTGQYVFSNQGDLDIVGTEVTTQLSLLGGNLGFRFYGAYNKALDSTDDSFVVNGQLGGATKSPELVGGAVVNVVPYAAGDVRINANVTFQGATKVEHRANPETQYHNVVGTDGVSYSSRAAADYPTTLFTLGAHLMLDYGTAWRFGVLGTNLTDRRQYAYGSLAVPLLREGRRVLATVAYQL